MRALVGAGIAAAVAISTGAPALAVTKHARFAVRASVISNCDVTATDLDFGVYDSTSAATGSNNISVKCTPGARVTVSLDGGVSGNPRNRYMIGPARLTYQLYRDAAHRDPLDGRGAVFRLRRRENTGQTVVYPVYGEIPANQTVPEGNYIDTIRVTVDY